MSRIGLTPITLPESVSVICEKNRVVVKGPGGELTLNLPPHLTLTVADGQVQVNRSRHDLQTKANHGLIRSLVANMVTGVTSGFTKKLELVGTGYRAKTDGKGLILTLGYSHPITFTPPAGIQVTAETETLIQVAGIDRQLVGQVAANLRAYRPPEPYKGKGVRYADEIIRRKAGKAAKAGASA